MGLNGLLGFKDPTHLMPTQIHPFNTPSPCITQNPQTLKPNLKSPLRIKLLGTPYALLRRVQYSHGHWHFRPTSICMYVKLNTSLLLVVFFLCSVINMLYIMVVLSF